MDRGAGRVIVHRVVELETTEVTEPARLPKLIYS